MNLIIVNILIKKVKRKNINNRSTVHSYSPFNNGKGCNSTSEHVRYLEEDDEPCERFVLRFNTDIFVNGSMRSTNVVAAPVDAVVPPLAALPALEAVAAVFDMLYISKCENFFFVYT